MISADGTFSDRSADALKDQGLQSSLAGLRTGFVAKRAAAVAAFAGFEKLRSEGQAIKDEALDNLDRYLEQYEAQVVAKGGHVHWARDAAEACQIIRDICRKENARTVTKGKSMVSEEIGLNGVLEADGLDVVETDAGEYIVQLAKEAPSHIVMPTVHKTVDKIADLFLEHHRSYGYTERETDAAALIAQVR
ncbi:MAG: LUD domain-containing protein, partial [Hyphomicrobium sp.]